MYRAPISVTRRDVSPPEPDADKLQGWLAHKPWKIAEAAGYSVRIFAAAVATAAAAAKAAAKAAAAYPCPPAAIASASAVA